MATEMTSSQLSPKAAFARIWKRLTDAVAEGKRKAGVSVKTESIMEAAKGGKLDMIDLGEDNLFGDPEQGMLDLGEENLFGTPEGEESSEQSETPAPTEPEPGAEAPAEQPAPTGRVLKGVVGGKTGDDQKLVITKRKPTRLTKAEREEEARRAKERQRQLDAENNYSVEEVQENWKSLFDYAYENREYLKDAGQLITEDEVRTLFSAEYNNYSGRNHGDSTDTAVSGVLDIFQKKLPTIIKKLDARLHGEGNFLMSGSLMYYLQRASHLANGKRTPIPQPSGTLGIKSKTVVNDKTSVLNQFVMTSDLQACEDWIRNRFDGYDMADDAVMAMALDILAMGTNKSWVVEQLGGRKDIPKEFAIPRYGTLERSGDNVIVLGTEGFVNDFNTMFDDYLDDADRSPDHVGAEVRKVNSLGATKFHGNLYGAAYNEARYLGVINDLAHDDLGRQRILLPITLDVGKVSTDQSGKGNGKGGKGGEKDDENRWADNLMSHRDEGNGMSVINANVGEQWIANGLMKLLGGAGAKKVAEMSGTGELLGEALKVGNEIGTLSKFSAAVMKWLCDTLGREYSTKNASGISAIIYDNEPSIIAEAGKNMSLDTGTRAALRAIENFNGAMSRHIKNSEIGGDIGDIEHMSPEEIREKATPDVHLGELARKCYDALERGNQTESLVTFGKGYLVYMMGGLFELPTNTPSLITNAARFASLMGTKPMNRGLIHQYILKMNADDVVAMARRLEDAAPEIMVGQEGGNIMYGDMYPDCNVPLNNLKSSGIPGAIAYISEMDPFQCICDCAETLCDMEPGTLSTYMADLKTCEDKADIEDKARTINNQGSGVVDLHMSDAGKERVKRVEPANKQPPKPAAPIIARFGRNRF
jgi:hypothetical protein